MRTRTRLPLRGARAPLETLAVDPALPEWLPEVTIHRLRIGAATVTLRFWRNSSGESESERAHTHTKYIKAALL